MSKKVKKNNLGLWAVIAIIGVIGLGLGVNAYMGEAPRVVVEGDYIEASQSGDVGMLGGSTSDDWDVGGNLTVAGTSAFTGATTFTGASSLGIITSGGSVNATTTDADTYTLVSADIATYNYLNLDHTGAANITYTMPATSTMIALLPSVGSTRTWTIHNASTTAVLTLAAGAGTNLLGIDTNVDTIAADGWATLECMQSSYDSAVNENIACLMAEYVVAD